MKRCFFLTCDGYKQGYIISKNSEFSQVVDLEGNVTTLKNWKVMEVRF